MPLLSRGCVQICQLCNQPLTLPQYWTNGLWRNLPGHCQPETATIVRACLLQRASQQMQQTFYYRPWHLGIAGIRAHLNRWNGNTQIGYFPHQSQRSTTLYIWPAWPGALPGILPAGAIYISSNYTVGARPSIISSHWPVSPLLVNKNIEWSRKLYLKANSSKSFCHSYADMISLQVSRYCILALQTSSGVWLSWQN